MRTRRSLLGFERLRVLRMPLVPSCVNFKCDFTCGIWAVYLEGRKSRVLLTCPRRVISIGEVSCTASLVSCAR
jgi:hypothetical protein